MTDRRKVKKRKESYEVVTKRVDKPSKDELIIAKWMKKNIPVKKTKFAGHNVEYFTGSKAVDFLLKSKWSVKEENKDALFISRQDVVYFLDAMLRHRFFHRAKKVPVSEQELKAKYGKKDRKSADEEKKKKDEETAESSHAECRDVEDKNKSQIDRKKKCCKIKLEMHSEQTFVDNLDAYVWIYDPIPLYYWIIGALVVLATVGVCLFPLWPPTVRMGVQYISMAAAGFLILILALAVLRLIIFCLVWLLTLGTFHLWLLPNLTEDVGFFASFWPLYQYSYRRKGVIVTSTTTKKDKDKEKKQKKKKDKESDVDEDTDKAPESNTSAEQRNRDASQSDSDSLKRSKKANNFDDEDGTANVDNSKISNGTKTVSEDDADKRGVTKGINDEETDTESSNGRQSLTGKDFEMVENTNDFSDKS